MLSFLFLLAAAFPTATISSGEITAKLPLPHSKLGYYRGTRFDWSGQISSLKTAKHEYFGVWFQKYDPKLHDAIQGPVEEFNADAVEMGYDQAPVGGTFLRIGVGVVRKPSAEPYQRFKTYDIVDHGKWKVDIKKDHAVYTHTVADQNGYGYRYQKTLRLQGKQLLIEHSLENTGQKKLVASQYNHNFFMMDQQTTGPAFHVTFADALTMTQPFKPELAKVEGGQISYLRELKNGESAFARFAGIKNYDVTVENSTTGAKVRIQSELPVQEIVYWSIPTTLCPEPYVRVDTEVGATTKWTYRYTFE
jgi:hypothetical protein